MGERVPQQLLGEANMEMALGLAVLIDPTLAVVIKHPERVQIVSLAHQMAISPSEYAKLADTPLSTASGHFKALHEADFLDLVEEVPVRGTVKHMYRATKRAYFSAEDWGKLAESIQEGVGAAVLQDFNAVVIEAMEAGTFSKRPETVLFWLAILLDEVSWPEFVKVLSWTITEVEELVEDTVKRNAKGESKGLFNAAFAIAGFETPEKQKGKAGKKGSRRKSPGKKQAQGKSNGTRSAKGEGKRRSDGSKQ